MRSRLVWVVAMAVSLIVGSTGVASAERFSAGNLLADFDAGVTPSKLPRDRFAPVTLTLSLDLRTADISVAPAPVHLAIELDRNARLNQSGLPACQPQSLANTGATEARAACAGSIVGTGTAQVKVVFPDPAPQMDEAATVTAFNGPPGQLLLHAFEAQPAPETVLVPLAIRPIAGGAYGTALDGDLPPIQGGYGRLFHLDLTLAKFTRLPRTRKHKARRAGFAEAGCRGGSLRTKFALTTNPSSNYGVTGIGGEVTRPCRAAKQKRRRHHTRRGGARHRSASSASRGGGTID